MERVLSGTRIVGLTYRMGPRATRGTPIPDIVHGEGGMDRVMAVVLSTSYSLIYFFELLDDKSK